MEHSGALGDLLKVESPCMLLTKLKTVARKQVHWLIPREKKNARPARRRSWGSVVGGGELDLEQLVLGDQSERG
jgi:hypothetical protein